jgi:hypothetical protein
MKFSFLSLRETAKALKKPIQETATLLQEAEVSHDDTEKALRVWCRGNRYAPDGTYLGRYLRAVYNSFFIYEESSDYGDTSRIFQASYSVDDAGALTVGDIIEVRVEVKYVPVEQSILESAKPVREATVGAFREAKIGDDGLILVKIIDAGVGSSGYYSADVLKAACEAGKFPAGLRMFSNHQTDEERRKQPENKVENVVAITRETGYWDEQGKDGPGVYAKSEVKSHWRSFVESMGYDMEVSIDGMCAFTWGEVNGKAMPIVESIVKVKSVDFVTQAGRGGRWMSLLEAARENDFSQPGTSLTEVVPDPNNPTKKEVETEMTEAEIQAAQETARIEGQKQGVQDGIALYKAANKTAREALANLNLPEVVKESIVSAQIGDASALPIKEGALDVDIFTTRVKDAAQNEAIRAREAYNWGEGTVEVAGSETKPVIESKKAASEVDAALARIL